jgi:hypothetical protein
VNILAVDPGKVTGLALWQHTALTNAWELDCWDAMAWVGEWLEHMGEPVAVVCERFTISQRTLNKTSDAHWAIGQGYVLEYLVRTIGAGHTFEYSAVNDAKTLATDARLKTLGWHQRTKGGHANDACRHALLKLAKIKYTPILNQLV